MYKKSRLGVASLVGGVLLSATTVQAQQSIVLSAGYFAPRGEATRVVDDVLVENLSVFAFDIKDFNGGSVGGEWIVGIGDYFDAGFGVGFYTAHRAERLSRLRRHQWLRDTPGLPAKSRASDGHDQRVAPWSGDSDPAVLRRWSGCLQLAIQ